jgi:hypothetical protein
VRQTITIRVTAAAVMTALLGLLMLDNTPAEPTDTDARLTLFDQ